MTDSEYFAGVALYGALLYNYSPEQIHNPQLLYPQDSDRGLFDVLQSFATSQGFKFQNKQFPDGPEDANASLLLLQKRIYMSDTLKGIARASILAHELAHYVLFRMLGMVKEPAAEQIAELVACRLLDDFGYDVWDAAGMYVYQFSNPDYLLIPGVDLIAGMVYHIFSTELNEFLKGD